MELVFLGVGEACDPDWGNTSLLVRTEGACLLLDCGFTVPHRCIACIRSADELDACFISHFHGDHVFGLPLLLLRLAQMGRSKPLLLVGQAGIGQYAMSLLELAYPGYAARLPFVCEEVELPAGLPLDALGLTWQTAPTEHGLENLCLRLDDADASLGYSGDGRPTPASTELLRGVSLLVHEAYSWQGQVANHGSVSACLELARECGAGRLALVHLHHEERRRHLPEIEGSMACWSERIWLPRDGELLTL